MKGKWIKYIAVLSFLMKFDVSSFIDTLLLVRQRQEDKVGPKMHR